ncbi:Adenylate kinase 2 [Saxophila tyrrhenica]|uniref:GTP:AMP phosphotransferase, mitochondrial n=1 Tax=Saxophila tyrrhenica TaxID=1690608 RepID=A0AAV9PHL5_9PEZI|nr:Adenylate kinase 2 [Saxophila tyrrhenica]
MSPNNHLRRAARIILVGAPGVGKGTHAERMLKRYPQLSSISSGDLLRENVRNKTPLGIQAEALMKRGELVPDNMILRLIRNSLTTKGWLVPGDSAQPITVNTVSTASNTSSSSAASVNVPRPTNSEYSHSDQPDASFILDGFPRTASQASQLDQLIPINLAIHVHTPTEIILDRICNRWIHPASGRTYNTTFNPPQKEGLDDVTGEKLVQRDDDNPEVWKARLKQFEDAAMPLLEHYDKLGVLWKVVGDSSDEISPKIFKEFERQFGA